MPFYNRQAISWIEHPSLRNRFANWRGENTGASETYDVDENIQRLPGPLLHQLRRVVLRPLCLFVLAEIAAECFLAPGAIARVGDWGVRGDGSVFAGVLEELMGRSNIELAMRCDAMQEAISRI